MKWHRAGVELPAINLERTSRLALSMKLLVYSDLHNEFDPFSPPMVNVDVVILAGDISTRDKGVEWANEAFNCLCLHVAGNHEFYGGHLDRTLEKMKAVAAPHVGVLENEVFVHGNVRFIGTTGWTDFTSSGDQRLAIGVVSDSMNDFRKIRLVGVAEYPHVSLQYQATPLIGIGRHHMAIIPLACNFHHRRMMGDHHSLPTERSAEQSLQPVTRYVVTLDQIIRPDSAMLICTDDAQVGSTRVVSNPRGYPNESTGFNSEFLVELGCV